ncbi:carboxypeptidase B-like [Oppia nitens]|uniref:carboxypeptidase B-like n=1 Tax=Oppia nitens TaxID=1686743 RepID=UPI0023DA46C7|nr:carboxypeptidase B-like [Oppia nitens]
MYKFNHLFDYSNSLVILLIILITAKCHSTGTPTNYSKHSIVKLRHEHLHLLNGHSDHNEINSPEYEPDILWVDTSSNNSSYAFVRLKTSHVRKIRSAPWFSRSGASIVTDNLQSWIGNTEMLSDSSSSSSHLSFLKGRQSVLVPSFALDRYHPLSQVNRYLSTISTLSNVDVIDIGISHEGRPIKAVQIKNNPKSSDYIWIDGCTHAREWITVATALFIIDNIISDNLKQNFIIVPIINVDGYEYTWNTDRLWRKNRRPYSASTLVSTPMPDRCNGVDLNRNYDINFGGEGGSSNPCSFLYEGPSPFSEPEVKAVSDLLWKFKNRIKLSISLHSFNQLWASPYAYTKSSSIHYDHHMDVLQDIQNAVYKTNGVKYQIGPLGQSLYVGSGFMMDWIYTKLGITNTYLCELRDKGVHGFLLPADQIMPTALETWNGILAAIRKLF